MTTAHVVVIANVMLKRMRCIVSMMTFIATIAILNYSSIVKIVRKFTQLTIKTVFTIVRSAMIACPLIMSYAKIATNMLIPMIFIVIRTEIIVVRFATTNM